jgi:hypothetical protein
MPPYDVVLLSGHTQRVEAQHCELQGRHWVFLTEQVVMNRPRLVVSLRLRAADVTTVTPA